MKKFRKPVTPGVGHYDMMPKWKEVNPNKTSKN
jgi:hypothetical protein